jgi:peptide/nickel transport system substrate-binding protein
MSKLTRREFLRFSTVAAAGALAAACAKTEAPTATPEAKAAAPTATPKPAEPTATPEPAAKPWPREDVPRNRTLVRMFGYSGGQFDNVGIVGPYATGASHQHSHAAEWEPLFYYSAFADKTYPWLAESHEYNEDATEITFHIRKGAKWNDGTPFTAADVEYTIQMLIDNAPNLRNSAAMQKWVKEVEAVDDHTVRVSLNEPNWRFHYTMFTYRYDLGTYLVPKHIYKDIEDPRDNPFFDPEKGWPVSTGAYQTVVFEMQHKYLDLRYEWWAAETGLVEMPKVERITHIPFSELNQAAQLVINNEIDVCLALPPTLMKSIVDQAPHVITHSGREEPYGYVDWWPTSLWFNTLEKPYDDPKVRWAMAYAINQQQVVDVGQKGAGMPTNVPFPVYPPLMKYIDSFDDILAKHDPEDYDLQKSEDLMKEAGFVKDDEGFWVDGEGNRPDADIYADANLFGDIAPIVAEQLRKGGFDSKHVSPPDIWTKKGDGTALLHFFGHGGSIADPYTTLDFYHSRHVKPTGESCGVNRCRWGNPDYDLIIDEMAVTPMEDPKLLDQTHAAMEIWYEELPELPLCQFFHRIPMNTTYWTNWPTEDNPYINGAPWHLTFPILLWNLEPTQ